MTTKKIREYIRRDPFSARLGAEFEQIEPGYSRVSLLVSEEMLNFHGSTHGGVIFSLGDLAFAAACNAAGQTAVALTISIGFVRASQAGDRLVAEARQLQSSGRTALYELVVSDLGSGEVIARSQATAYRKKEHFLEGE